MIRLSECAVDSLFIVAPIVLGFLVPCFVLQYVLSFQVLRTRGLLTFL